MLQYIDKSALIAEIKRIEYETNYETFTDEVLGKRYVCKSLLSFLNTPKVKVVDLEKELKNLIGNVGQCDRKLAKHFFELGLKAKKGE